MSNCLIYKWSITWSVSRPMLTTMLNYYYYIDLKVSNVDSFGEGWKWVDELDNVCEPPKDGIFHPGKPLPTVVHFCQGYRVGEYGFGKRGLRKDIFTCEAPMMADPPADLAESLYSIRNNEVSRRYLRRSGYLIIAIPLQRIDKSKLESKRNAFMVSPLCSKGCPLGRSIYRAAYGECF